MATSEFPKMFYLDMCCLSQKLHEIGKLLLLDMAKRKHCNGSSVSRTGVSDDKIIRCLLDLPGNASQKLLK